MLPATKMERFEIHVDVVVVVVAVVVVDDDECR